MKRKYLDEIIGRNYTDKTYRFICREYSLKLSYPPLIMGVLNVTPDSFSDGGRFFDEQRALKHALRMEREGADIIDIGAESTRPGAKRVSAAEQLRRIEKIVGVLSKRLDIPISIDTSSSLVARKCLERGASIINDIYALRRDKKLAAVAAEYNAGLILMHMKGTPATMQKKPEYKDVIKEVIDFLARAKKQALSAGVKKENIILDPGIGFGKTTEHNLKLLNRISRFKPLGSPLLIGTSRKSFIGQVLDVPVKKRDAGTAISLVFAALNGAKIVRVHNVKEMKQAITLCDAIIREKI